MRRQSSKIKKIIVLVVLVLCLITMSNAYALWSDSVDVGVKLKNAIVRLDYIERETSANNISYIMQGDPLAPPSELNVYHYIEESVTSLYYGSDVVVEYTIKNTGDVPVYFTELDVDNLTMGGYSEYIRIEYDLVNESVSPSYNYNTSIDPNNGHDGVDFPNASTQNLLQAGDSCTLTVTYYRVSAGSGFFNWLINSFAAANISTREHPVYVIA